jgi:GST-like protein
LIDLYTWSTPNGRKVSIMLEECALPYVAHPIDIGKGDQFKPEFVAIQPNSKIPRSSTVKVRRASRIRCSSPVPF